jgi:hypothetical protein
MKRLFRRPSPAMVVAIVALIAALGGTAVAGGVLNKKKVNNIITNRAPGLSVASAKSADSAATATRSQGPVGWAQVNSAGTVIAGNNVATANVTKVGFFYCFSGLSFPLNGAVAATDYWNGSPHFSTMLQVGFVARGGLAGTGCPVATQVFVHTLDAATDTPEVGAFWIEFLN